MYKTPPGGGEGGLLPAQGLSGLDHNVKDTVLCNATAAFKGIQYIGHTGSESRYGGTEIYIYTVELQWLEHLWDHEN